MAARILSLSFAISTALIRISVADETLRSDVSECLKKEYNDVRSVVSFNSGSVTADCPSCGQIGCTPNSTNEDVSYTPPAGYEILPETVRVEKIQDVGRDRQFDLLINTATQVQARIGCRGEGFRQGGTIAEGKITGNIKKIATTRDIQKVVFVCTNMKLGPK